VTILVKLTATRLGDRVVGEATLRLTRDAPPSGPTWIAHDVDDLQDWLTSRHRLRDDAESLLREGGVSPTRAAGDPYRELLREVMRELWLGLTGTSVDALVFDRWTWAGLGRGDREVLRAQWKDGLDVTIEDVPGDPHSRRPAFSW